MRPMDIAERAKRLNITQKRLAELSSLDKNTVGRALKHTDAAAGGPFRTTDMALAEALDRAELDLLAYLAERHPQEAIALSTVALCPDRKAARASA